MHIETDRLSIRDLKASDQQDMLRVFGSFLGISGDALENNVRGWIKYYLHHQQIHGYGMYAVISKANNLVIGDCGLEFYENIGGRSEVELAYEYDRKYWGQGYATEAAIAVSDYAFHILGMRRLVSFISPDNSASRRVIEKAGFTVEKTVLKDEQDVYVYVRAA